MLEKKSFTLSGHRTSVALEPEFWLRLAALASSVGLTLSAFVAEVDVARAPGSSLASSLRLRALRDGRAQTATSPVTG